MEANSELEMLRNVKKGVLNLSDRSKVSTLKSDSGPDSDNEWVVEKTHDGKEKEK